MKTLQQIFTKSTITAVILIVLVSATIKLDEGSIGTFDKFGNLNPCSLDKKKDGSAVAYTQSAHDQTFPGTCKGCHGGGTTTPQVSVVSEPAWENNTYMPGTTYTIRYTVTGYPKFGIDVEMNEGNTVTSMTAGTLAASTNTRYTANPYNQGFPSNISHSAPVANSAEAVFTWTAPTDSVDVYLFSNIVGVNANNNDNGDKEVFYNQVLTSAGPAIAQVTKQAKPEMTIYLNPLGDQAQLNYSLPQAGKVNIELIDMSGRRLNQFANENQTAGKHQMYIHTADLAKGTYLIKLSLNGTSSSKKIQIL